MHIGFLPKINVMHKLLSRGRLLDLIPIIEGTTIYASLYVLLSSGLTLTYMTTNVPNFAHGAVSTAGAYFSFTLFTFYGWSPYSSIPMCFLIGGAVDYAIYTFAIRPVAKKERTTITLMVATLAADIFLTGIFGIYSDYLVNVYKIFNSRFFILAGEDPSIFGLPGLVILGPVLIMCILTAIHLFLTKTKFGVALRATVENPLLAQVLGVNTNRVYAFAWFLSGGLAGIAGSLMILWIVGSPAVGDSLLPGIFAASLVGGLHNMYGALVGGIIVAGGQIMLTSLLASLVGSWIIVYGVGIPLLIMIATLLFFPEGVTSLNLSRFTKMLRGK
jgi:branched-chain amino acid transport system permease protein